VSLLDQTAASVRETADADVVQQEAVTSAVVPLKIKPNLAEDPFDALQFRHPTNSCGERFTHAERKNAVKRDEPLSLCTRCAVNRGLLVQVDIVWFFDFPGLLTKYWQRHLLNQPSIVQQSNASRSTGRRCLSHSSLLTVPEMLSPRSCHRPLRISGLAVILNCLEPGESVPHC
jgi:hypothetical protein